MKEDIQDEKMLALYEYFEQYHGSEEFYVGDILGTIEMIDKRFHKTEQVSVKEHLSNLSRW